MQKFRESDKVRERETRGPKKPEGNMATAAKVGGGEEEAVRLVTLHHARTLHQITLVT